MGTANSRRSYVFRPYTIFVIPPVENINKGTEFPRARSGHRIVYEGGNIYSYGGFNPEVVLENNGIEENSLLQELWKFNLPGKCWTKMQTTGRSPKEAASHTAVMFDNQLIVFGGTSFPFGITNSNKVNVCNLKTLKWQLMKTVGKKPREQYGQAVILHEDKLFVVGGTTGTEFSIDVHCLYLSAKKWCSLDLNHHITVPESRYRHEIAIYDDQIFVFGGGTNLSSYGFRELPVFKIATSTWIKLPTSGDCPLPRKCHSCVQLKDNVYIYGGCNGDEILADLWKINLRTLEWTKLPCNQSVKLYFHSAAATEEGQMFMFGGITSIPDSNRTNALHSVWLKIPSLKEICWDAVLFYMPNIASIDKLKLHELGIPINFLRRIETRHKEIDRNQSNQ